MTEMKGEPTRNGDFASSEISYTGNPLDELQIKSIIEARELFYKNKPVARKYLLKYYSDLQKAGWITDAELKDAIDSINLRYT